MNKFTSKKNTAPRQGGGRPKQAKRGRVSTIDPNDLIKKAVADTTKPYVAPISFDDLDIHESLKATIREKGYVTPTQIQAESIDYLIEGRDIVGIANTGTGKTGAFLIPIINRLLNQSKKFQTLIVLPTRELALQVDVEFRSLTKGLNFKGSTFIGGTSVGKDLDKLRRHNDIIIGTPGRLIDMMDQGALKLGKFSVLVLDEFDRMLDMGFIRDIQKILDAMKEREQTMLFSATVEPSQEKLIQGIVKNPVNVSVSTGTTTAELIDQDVIHVKGGDKFVMLTELLSGNGFEKVLVFAETKRGVDRLSQKLRKSGFTSDVIHGNKSQNYRVNALNDFKKGKIKILVATDVAARGIDIADITHVINYQMPGSIDTYIHRIGRTGRAGASGQAYTFVD